MIIISPRSTVVFSVRTDPKKLDRWKAYATASGMTISEMVTDSIEEYIESHELTGLKKKVFDRHTERKNMDVSVREWIEEEATKAYNYQIERQGYALPEDTAQAYINYLVEQCVDGWEGTEDVFDDKNGFWRDSVVDYLEEKTENDVPEMVEKHQMDHDGI